MSEFTSRYLFGIRAKAFPRGDFSLYELTGSDAGYDWRSVNLFFSSRKDESYFSISQGVNAQVAFDAEMLYDGQRSRFLRNSFISDHPGLCKLMDAIDRINRKPFVDRNGREFRFLDPGYPCSSFVVETNREVREVYFRVSEDEDEAYTFSIIPEEKVTESVLGRRWSRRPFSQDKERLQVAFLELVPWAESIL